MRRNFLRKKTILSFLIFVLFGIIFFVDIFGVNADEISSLKKEIDQQQEKKEKTEQELNTAQTMLQKNQYQLNITKDLLVKTENDIKRRKKEIEELENQIEINRKILESYIREMYFGDQQVLENFLASESDLSLNSDNFFQFLSVKEKILSVMDEIDKAKDQEEKAKKDMEEKKDDHEKLLSIQSGQQYQIKSDITRNKATLSQINSKINKLRAELTNILGSSVSFNDVISASKYASKVTGIRKDYLLGVLVVESNLGRYTGGCDYKESRMSDYRKGIFRDICEGLKYNYKKMKVSCPPSGYSGTGGAMGVAQFMPDTWIGYQSSITAVTGHNPPDPWSLTDGVVAMALKLTKVNGVTNHKESAEAKAYCVYLAGNNWASYCDNNGTNYGDLVLYWADNYEKLLGD